MTEIPVCKVCGKNPRTPRRRVCVECLKKERHAAYMKIRDTVLARAKEQYHNRTPEEIARAKARYREYINKRYEEDPEFNEKRRQQSREYYTRQREKLLAKGRAYYRKTREERLAYARKYYVEHLDRFVAYREKYKAIRAAERAKRTPTAEKPCSHCHSAPRHRNTSWCAACLAEYQHEYYLKHRGKGRNGRDQINVEAEAQAV